MTDIGDRLEDKKRYLKKYKKNNACIQRLIDKRDDLEIRLTSVSSPSMSDMPKGSSPITNAALILEKIELDERISRLQSKGLELRRGTLLEIDKLDDPTECEILERFFINGETFDDIADDLGYNIKSIIRIYSRALHILADTDD